MNNQKSITEVTDAKQFGKVAVLFGGTSAEREVSLNSGKAVIAALQHDGVDVHPIDPGENVFEQLKSAQFDRAFIVLHGRGGEDGVIQAVLQSLAIPYTGSGVQASALAMDKLRTKLLWLGADLPTPPFVILDNESSLATVESTLGFPVIVKPVHEGSSIGISRAENNQELKASWQEAAKYDSEIIAEAWITGGEYTVAILDGEPLPVIKMETDSVFYDYEAKYLSNDTRYLCPCGLPAEKEKEIQAIALKAFKMVGAQGWGRVDFMLNEQGVAGLIEANTVPGMTDHSLVPMAAKQAGIEFNQLVWRILQTSI
ncbi:D-alanine--D-alanine ligase [hydrothermal vent metagenome]|uniref:D-alanine--D-alanine ligase B n=1 Tax=hydrothermal vent metagenome TaxID=652676 RepID=A0A3B0XVJ3_9ZZZZ